MSPRLTVARHHLDTGNPQRALEVIKDLAPEELTGAEAEAYEIGADAKYALGDPLGACDFARKALAIEPDNLEALRTLAWASSDLGDHQTVSSTMSRALVAAPQSVTILVDCASLLLREGRLPEASEFVTRATNIAPDAISVKAVRMEYERAMGFHLRARKLAHEILAVEPDHVMALAVDAIVAEQNGDIRTSAKRLRKIAALRLGDQEIAMGARESTAWSHPFARPAWWLIQRRWGRMLGLCAVFALLRLTLNWFEDKEMPFPPVYIALAVVVGYFGICLAWVDEKKSGPGRKWVPRD